jgi:hypothetical protein
LRNFAEPVTLVRSPILMKVEAAETFMKSDSVLN